MPESSSQVGSVFGSTALARSLWPHQQEALAAFERDRERGDVATYLVVPPGGGKTLIGLEAARRLDRPTVVLCPNTAIQAQWIAEWHSAFAPSTVAATVSREVPTPLTVLTYQALCTLGASGEDEPPGDSGRPGPAATGFVTLGPPAGPHPPAPRTAPDDDGLLSLLHPNGLALIERLRAGGPWTLVLDECHHLLELWGRLLKTVIGQLQRPHVIGLTATPPHMMTAQQADLHAALFGSVDLEVATPALVRDGRLAPYQELAFFARPTPPETDYIHGEAVRFTELRTDLLDPGFAATPFLEWLQARVVERRGAEGAQVSWQRFEHDEPALADAAIRLHTAGLLPLPEGARIREQHRHAPTADDWIALIGDYCSRCLHVSGDPRDERAYQAIRHALPAVGYRLTRSGARAGVSPVDRVLARSESKARAAAEILAAEAGELGPRLRALVLCDFEEAGGTLPARLLGVLAPEAGGARLALETLLSDRQSAALDPVLMTGRRVACSPGTARALVRWLRAAEPRLDLAAVAAGEQVAEVTGPGWEPRRYVPLVTRFFAEGGSRCLVGTRALLGEGWDAPPVNVLVDLTAATTPTSVVQARGRPLRLDATWPGKVADNWAVVCVTEDHPKGAADYDRLVRKHDRYFALAHTGEIISGVAHIDPALSPYAPPARDRFDTLNAAMLQRPADRAAARERWAIGTGYQDEPVTTVTVTTQRSLGLAGRATASLARRRTAPRWGAIILTAAVIALLGVRHAPLAAALAGLAVAAAFAVAARTAARVSAPPAKAGLEDLALATADALNAAGLTSRGGSAVVVEAFADGGYRARLGDVTAGESEVFTSALDDVLSPLAQPRYVIPRLIVEPPAGLAAGYAMALRRLVLGRLPGSVVYHAVPAVLAANKSLATCFERAWNARVSPGTLVYAGSPEGAGILAAQRGDDPFAVTTQIRTLWR